MTENEKDMKIKELQEQLNTAVKEHDKLYNDYIDTKRYLQNEKSLSDRYLKIIENLTMKR